MENPILTERNTTVFENGATWLRADFHLHTIKDKEFDKIANSNEFIKLFINKLKDEDIKIGVITNHNKFDREEYKNLYKKAKKEDIWILPGVELSVNDGANGIHCLIIFDKDRWIKDNEDFINQFLTSAFEGVTNRENENTRCNYSLDGLLNKLNEHRNQGRDSFLILAHVDQSSGFFEELDGGRIQLIAKNELFKSFVLGFQKFRTYDKLDTYKQWFGGKLPAFVEGSDCKSINEVGRAHQQQGVDKKTFVKIGDFNFEALKYALIDSENRIKSEMPRINNSYIKSIEFEGGKLNGIKISFSPELNNFIGIRGSGKSTILEILRYTLGIPLSKISADSKYKNELIQFMIGSGGKSTINIVNKRSEEYRIEKIYGQKEDIFDSNGNLMSGITFEGILFDDPVYFGQKDLSNKDADFESDLLQRLLGNKFKQKIEEINGKVRDIEHIIIELNKIKNLKELKEETDVQINNAKNKLNYFKEQGVEEKLKHQTQFDLDRTKLQQTKEALKGFYSDVDDLIRRYDYLSSQPVSLSEINNDISELFSQLQSKIDGELNKLKGIQAQREQILSEIDNIIAKLEEKYEGLKEYFAKIKRDLNSETLNPDDFLRLNRIIETSKLKLVEINKSETRRKQLNKELDEKLVQLNTLWLEQYRVLEEEISKINKVGNKLSIKSYYKGKRIKFRDKLEQMFRGTNIRGASYDQIVSEYQDFIEIKKDKGEKLKSILNERQFADFLSRYKENYAELLTYKVEDEIIIEYDNKPLYSHSLGQRASALILFLLAQKENDILIIDQPEDDLDNQTIYDEVIKEIIKLKKNMQFIFATHNANIPVLGDSEMVASCSFDDKVVVKQGSIDTPEIQQSIVDIMEGGEEAFRRRKDIYSIWNI